MINNDHASVGAGDPSIYNIAFPPPQSPDSQIKPKRWHRAQSEIQAGHGWHVLAASGLAA
jgi:hypothetical protein